MSNRMFQQSNTNFSNARMNMYQNNNTYDLYNNRQTLIFNLGIKVKNTNSVEAVNQSIGGSDSVLNLKTVTKKTVEVAEANNDGVYTIDLLNPLVIDNPSVIELEGLTLFAKPGGSPHQIIDRHIVLSVDKFNIRNCTNDPHLSNKIVIGNTNAFVDTLSNDNFISDNGNMRYSHVATINPGSYSQFKVTVHGYNSVNDGPPKKIKHLDVTAPNIISFIIIEKPPPVIIPRTVNDHDWDTESNNVKSKFNPQPSSNMWSGAANY